MIAALVLAAEAAGRLLRLRPAKGEWPYSVIESEARAAGIPIDALAVAASALGVKTVEGR